MTYVTIFNEITLIDYLDNDCLQRFVMIMNFQTLTKERIYIKVSQHCISLWRLMSVWSAFYRSTVHYSISAECFSNMMRSWLINAILSVLISWSPDTFWRHVTLSNHVYSEDRRKAMGKNRVNGSVHMGDWMLINSM